MTFDPSAAATADSGVYGLPHDEKAAKVVLIPVPFDATTSYRAGTAQGPDAILAASRQVDLFDRMTGRPYEAGIYMLPLPDQVLAWNSEARRTAEDVIAAGGVNDDQPELAQAAKEVNVVSAKLNDWVYRESKRLLAAGKLVGTVGGDHAVPFGAIQAHAEKYPGMGVLHLDAHADLRVAYEGFEWSHASIMFNVIDKIPGVHKLVQVGIRDFSEPEAEYVKNSKGRIVSFYDSDLAEAAFEGKTWRAQVDEIVAALPENVYLSFDIDGLSPMFCPNTGTPVPGGLDFNQTVALVQGVRRAKKRIVGFDLCEVAPAPTGPMGERPPDEWDANVGARLLYKMIGFALLG